MKSIIILTVVLQVACFEQTHALGSCGRQQTDKVVPCFCASAFMNRYLGPSSIY